MLLMDLDPGDERPVYRQIVEEIQRCVAVGVMRPVRRYRPRRRWRRT